MRRYWTPETIVAALQRYARRNGRSPTMNEWRLAPRSYSAARPWRPTAKVIISRFGTWNAASRPRVLSPARKVAGRLSCAAAASTRSATTTSGSAPPRAPAPVVRAGACAMPGGLRPQTSASACGSCTRSAAPRVFVLAAAPRVTCAIGSVARPASPRCARITAAGPGPTDDLYSRPPDATAARAIRRRVLASVRAPPAAARRARRHRGAARRSGGRGARGRARGAADVRGARAAGRGRGARARAGARRARPRRGRPAPQADRSRRAARSGAPTSDARSRRSSTARPGPTSRS